MGRNRKPGAGPAPRPAAAAATPWGRVLLFATLLTCPLLFSTATLESFEFPKVLLLQGVALVFAVAGLLRLACGGSAARSRLLSWRGDPVSWSVLAVVAAGAASCAGSISPLVSWRGGHETFAGLMTVGSYAVLFLALRHLCRETRDFRGLLPAVAWAVAGAAGYALLQVARLDPIRWTRTQEFLGLWRAQGTLGNPTLLGGFLAVALPLVAYLALEAARRRAWAATALWGLVCAAGLGALGVTLARGAWLAAAGAAAVMSVGLVATAPSPAVRRRLSLAGVALVLLAVAGVTAWPPARRVVATMARRVVLTVQTRTEARPEAGVSYQEEPRLALWRVALRLWRDHPGLGVGLDAFQLGYPRYRSLEVWRVSGHRTPQNAHDELLQTLATQGTAGGLALLALAAALIGALVSGWRHVPAERPLLAAVAASLVAAAVHLAFSFSVASLVLPILLLAALLSRLGREEPAPSPPPKRGRPGEAWALLLAGAALLIPLEWSLVLQPLRADMRARAAEVADAGRPGAGLADLRRAVAIDPTRDLLWTRLGVSAFAMATSLPQGSQRAAFLAESRQAFEHAAALVPVNPYHQQSQGQVLVEQALDRPPAATASEALAAFERALALDPHNPYLVVESGRAALRLDDEPHVRAAATRCEATDALYGACDWLMGNLDIIKAFAPGQAPAERDRLLNRAGERLKKAVYMHWYLDDMSQALAASQGAAALITVGRLQEGRQLAEVAVFKAPDLHDARYNLGQALERMGDHEGARRTFQEVLARNPRHAESAAALRALDAAGGGGR